MNRKQGFNPLNCIPRDPVAARVVFSHGIQYEASVKSKTQLNQDVPHKMRSISSLPLKVAKDPNFFDFTGFKYGDFIVMGMLYADKFDKWVLRCCCGMYEIRMSSRLKTTPTCKDQTCCQSCMDLARIQNKDYWEKHGLYPWQNKRER